MAIEARYHEYASAIGVSVQAIGEAATVKRFGCTRGFARYHGEKHVNPQFHAGAWGGAMGAARYAPEVEDVIRFLLWQEVKADPLRTIKQFTQTLNRAGWTVTHDWVNRTFKRWGISRQRPNYKNLNKFTSSNILYYRSSLVLYSHLFLRIFVTYSMLFKLF